MFISLQPQDGPLPIVYVVKYPYKQGYNPSYYPHIETAIYRDFIGAPIDIYLKTNRWNLKITQLKRKIIFNGVINGVINPFKWPYKWVTGVITLLITSRGPPCSQAAHFCRV